MMERMDLRLMSRDLTDLTAQPILGGEVGTETGQVGFGMMLRRAAGEQGGRKGPAATSIEDAKTQAPEGAPLLAGQQMTLAAMLMARMPQEARFVPAAPEAENAAADAVEAVGMLAPAAEQSAAEPSLDAHVRPVAAREQSAAMPLPTAQFADAAQSVETARFADVPRAADMPRVAETARFAETAQPAEAPAAETPVLRTAVSQIGNSAAPETPAARTQSAATARRPAFAAFVPRAVRAESESRTAAASERTEPVEQSAETPLDARTVETRNAAATEQPKIEGSEVRIETSAETRAPMEARQNREVLSGTAQRREARAEGNGQPQSETVSVKSETAVREEVRPEFRVEAKPEIKEEIRSELREEVKPALREEAGPEFREEVKPALREEARPEFREEAKPEIKEEIKSELREEVKPEVKEEIRSEFKEEVKPAFREEAGPEFKEEARPEFREEIKPEIKDEVGTAQPERVSRMESKAAQSESGESGMKQSGEEKAAAQTAGTPVFRDAESVPVKVAEAPVPLSAEDGMERLADTLKETIVYRPELSRVEIKLAPEALGKVTVEITRHEDGTLNVVLHTESRKAAELLERGADSLRGMLSHTDRPVQLEIRGGEDRTGQFLNPDGQNDRSGQQQRQQQQQRRPRQHETQDFIAQLRLGLVDLRAG